MYDCGIWMLANKRDIARSRRSTRIHDGREDTLRFSKNWESKNSGVDFTPTGCASSSIGTGDGPGANWAEQKSRIF